MEGTQWCFRATLLPQALNASDLCRKQWNQKTLGVLEWIIQPRVRMLCLFHKSGVFQQYNDSKHTSQSTQIGKLDYHLTYVTTESSHFLSEYAEYVSQHAVSQIVVISRHDRKYVLPVFISCMTLQFVSLGQVFFSNKLFLTIQ